jgi:hypothetical protein
VQLAQVKQLTVQTRIIEKTLRNEMFDAMPLPGVFDQAGLDAKPPLIVSHYSPLKTWRPPVQVVSGAVGMNQQPVSAVLGTTKTYLNGVTRHYAAAAYTDLDLNGIYNARLRIYGDFGSGFQYQRTSFRTVTAYTRLGNKPNKGWLIVGSVHDNNGKPVTDVVVEAKDKDIFFNDYLGVSYVDARGKFEIYYDAKDFTDLIFDKRPDIYLKVFSKDGELLHISPVRYNAGPKEEFRLIIACPQ